MSAELATDTSLTAELFGINMSAFQEGKAWFTRHELLVEKKLNIADLWKVLRTN
jgi:hypothetical protein